MSVTELSYTQHKKEILTYFETSRTHYILRSKLQPRNMKLQALEAGLISVEVRSGSNGDVRTVLALGTAKSGRESRAPMLLKLPSRERDCDLQQMIFSRKV